MRDCCDDRPEPERGAIPVDAASPAPHDCCSAKQDELSVLASDVHVRRVLLIVLVINLAMFVAEFSAGLIARSTALMADSVDMLGDGLVYMLSLYALDRGARWKAGAALVKGILIAAFGAAVAFEAASKIVSGVVPLASTMVLFGFIALAANLVCLVLLSRHRNRDVNMSSTFECSRNDVIAKPGRAAGCSRGPGISCRMARHRDRRHHRDPVLAIGDSRHRRGLASILVRASAITCED